MEEIQRFITDCLVAAGSAPPHAKLMADLLYTADYRGHFSHGMNRLEWYINDLEKGSIDGRATPKILKESPATAWVDGCNGLGAVVGRFCMDLAIQKAKSCGVGWVCAKRSSHYGICGWYTIYAQQQGFIGMSMTNTTPTLCPTRSLNSVLGTNPISFAAPADNGDSFVLDMASTTVATGKIEIQKRKGEPIPAGWALDHHGNVTTDASVALSATRSLPLGGNEITSGYKGYGLAAMVEVLCGALTGATMSPYMRKWSLDGAAYEPDIGQVFIALDPSSFAPGFESRVSEMNGILRNLPAVRHISLPYDLI